MMMSTEPEDEDEGAYQNCKMSEETRASVTVFTQMLVTAEENGVRWLFAPQALEIFQSLFGSNDYWSVDGESAIMELEDQVVALFTAREKDLQTDWRAMYHCWRALLTEIY
jgi:hypothetical protein